LNALAVRTRRPAIRADIETDPGTPEELREVARARGYRSDVAVPMLRDGVPIGTINVSRREPGPFPEHQIDLLRTFADQAVIAIENVRLFNETKEALERQTATAEILNVISRSPTDVRPVFDAIVRSATRLCESAYANVFRFDGELLHYVTSHGWPPHLLKNLLNYYPARPDRLRVAGRVILEKQTVRVEDTLSDPEYDPNMAKAMEYRRILGVPLLREDSVIGAIAVGWTEPGTIQRKHEDLLKTFADQAVIAIENVRLFNETKEALERQTATGEILASISGSMSDTKPVFDAIVANTLRLLGTSYCFVVLVRDGMLEVAALEGEPAFKKVVQNYPRPLDEETFGGQAILTRKTVHVAPVIGNPAAPEIAQRFAREYGFNAVLMTPMIREGKAIGAIGTAHRDGLPFNDKQIALIQSFAAQAVIAIENARLFNETKEALERQTATAEILKVIASSPSDVQPVFDAIMRSAARLFVPFNSAIYMLEDGKLIVRAVAVTNDPVVIDDTALKQLFPMPLERSFALGKAITERRIIEIPDTEAPAFPEEAKRISRAFNVRSSSFVPLLREGEAIGVIAIGGPAPGLKLSGNQLALAKTFADQAVIAIENVRLFNELQERTEALGRSVRQLTALSEVGQAISSTLELETVLKTIVANAVKLTGLDSGVIYELDEARGEFELRASENFDEESVAGLRTAPIRSGEGAIGRAVVTRAPAEVPDTHAPDYPVRLRELLDRQGFRAVLAVPLVREDHVIGALMVLRTSPGAFAPEIVELLKTFASQSALAIQNARLFREIEEKGRQLETASRHKSQFLASMSHELRTPLNAILGFNEMLLGQVYGEVPGDMKEPLEDIQKSGRHLLRLINNVLDLAKIEAGRMELALGDYSVQDVVENVRATLRPLAAEKGLEFTATVPVDLPLAYGDGGRLSQCLLNLAGNSLKFTKQGRVEISVEQRDGTLLWRVADTGMGIPADKIGSLFTEFKQTDATVASEYGGTGLGLSITKKFIELHGGRIWVESEPGKGSTFAFEIPLRAGERKAA
jgi:GAF domain-containing protein